MRTCVRSFAFKESVSSLPARKGRGPFSIEPVKDLKCLKEQRKRLVLGRQTASFAPKVFYSSGLGEITSLMFKDQKSKVSKI